MLRLKAERHEHILRLSLLAPCSILVPDDLEVTHRVNELHLQSVTTQQGLVTAHGFEIPVIPRTRDIILSRCSVATHWNDLAIHQTHHLFPRDIPILSLNL